MPIKTTKDFIKTIAPEKQTAFTEIVKVIDNNIPKGFEQTINGNFINWQVPLSTFPAGYHCTPNTPLPFMSLAAQKNSINLYHMGIYANPELLKWFQEEYAKAVPTKIDMGKSCIRFKKLEQIPYELIGSLANKMTVQNWIDIYTSALDNRKK